MLPDWLVDAFLNHWGMLVIAPVPFLSVGALALVTGWLFRKSWDRDSVEHWRGLVAEYKDKLHDATPIEVANKIIQLEMEVAALKGDVSRQAQRVLAADQRKALIECLQQSQTFTLQYRVRPDDSEAIQYVMQFIATLYDVGKSLGAYMSCTEIPLDLQGLVIQVWDKEKVPLAARGVSGRR